MPPLSLMCAETRLHHTLICMERIESCAPIGPDLPDVMLLSIHDLNVGPLHVEFRHGQWRTIPIGETDGESSVSLETLASTLERWSLRHHSRPLIFEHQGSINTFLRDANPVFAELQAFIRFIRPFEQGFISTLQEVHNILQDTAKVDQSPRFAEPQVAELAYKPLLNAQNPVTSHPCLHAFRTNESYAYHLRRITAEHNSQVAFLRGSRDMTLPSVNHEPPEFYEQSSTWSEYVLVPFDQEQQIIACHSFLRQDHPVDQAENQLMLKRGEAVILEITNNEHSLPKCQTVAKQLPNRTQMIDVATAGGTVSGENYGSL